MGIKIIKAGLQTTIQDLGRFGLQRYGMVVGGAMDTYALRLGNMLLGNEEGEAGIECSFIGPTIYFEKDQLICITGGDLSPMINGVSFTMWKPVFVAAGDLLTFGRPRSGCRAYVCVLGGLDVPELFGSRSTYIKGAIGGWKGRVLQPEDQIPYRCNYTMGRKLFRWSMDTRLYLDFSKTTIRVMEGPDLNQFDCSSKERFFSEEFVISKHADRMGYRLESGPLSLKKQKEQLSSAVTYGSIQVPPQGRAIVLMADHPTTGGYPIIGQIATVDLPLFAQKVPSSRIQFSRITVIQAQNLLHEQYNALQELKRAITFKYD